MQTLNLLPVNIKGSHLTQRFATDSHQMNRFDNLISGPKNDLPSHQARKKMDFVKTFIPNLTLLVKIIKEVDYVI